jgi:hypothetical protein
VDELTVTKVAISTMVHASPGGVVAMWHEDSEISNSHVPEEHMDEIHFRLRDGVIEAYWTHPDCA